MKGVFELMLSCREVVQILSSEEGHGFSRRTQLRFHLMMCQHCSRYSAQLRMIAQGFKTLFENKSKIETKNFQGLEAEVIKKVSGGKIK